jgi:putative spermidine/putrescine transport system permease protein
MIPRGKSLNRLVGLVFTIYAIIFIIVLYGPLLVVGLLSFQGPDGGVTFPMRGVSLYWYKQLLSAGPEMVDFGSALRRSLSLAVLTAIISTVLAVATSLAFRRHFRGKNAIFFLILLGIVMPGALLGLGVRLVMTYLDIQPGLYTTGLLVHVAWTFPFGFLFMLAVFNRFDVSLEEAARNLGASPWMVLRTVTLPLARPGWLSALLFGFTLSYDETARSLLTVGYEMTIPVALASLLWARIRPEWFAFGVISSIVGLTAVVVYVLLMWRTVRQQMVVAVAQEAIAAEALGVEEETS